MSAQTDSNLPQTDAAATAQGVSEPEPELSAIAPSDPEKDDIAAWLDSFADAPDDDAPLAEGQCCESRNAPHPDALRASTLPTGGRVNPPPPVEETAAEEATQWQPRIFAVPLSPAQEAAAREAEHALRFEPWLTEIFAMMATTQPLSDDERRALHFHSDILALWALCEAPACRRQGACRGSEPHCFGAVGALVPACALPFLAGVVAGQLDGLAFDDMLAQLPEGTVQHWAAWHAAVTQITGRASYRHRRG